MKKKKVMTGDNGSLNDSLFTIFDLQTSFQKKITNIDLPHDDVKWYSYHVQALVEEMGEMLKADKRWKTHRNEAFDPENKLEEIADCFITLINISLYSGFSVFDIQDAIIDKIVANTEKLEKLRERARNDSNS